MLWRGFLIAQRVEQRGPRSERLQAKPRAFGGFGV